MILWKPDLELIKRRKKENYAKMGRYKGLDIGPFERRCNGCNVNIIKYGTYRRMARGEEFNAFCPTCMKKYMSKRGNRPETEYCRPCPECSENIFYKSIKSLISATKDNGGCVKCANKALSKKYENGGILQHKSEEEKKEIYSQTSISVKKHWEENPEKFKEKNIKAGKARAGHPVSPETRKKISDSIKKSHKEDPIHHQIKSDAAKKRHIDHPEIAKKNGEFHKQRYIDNPELRTQVANNFKKYREENPEKYYKDIQKGLSKLKTITYAHGIECQGTSEKAYINLLFKNNETLPERCKDGIKTSLGYYFPDFEFPDHFIEIKSLFYYEFFSGIKKRKNGTTNEREDKQRLKIIEATMTSKPVHVIIINNKGKNKRKILKIEIYDKDGIRTIKNHQEKIRRKLPIKKIA